MNKTVRAAVDLSKATMKLGYEAGTYSARERVERLETALRYAREKLELYRAEHSGAYVGGIEYTALIKMIDAVLASANSPACMK